MADMLALTFDRSREDWASSKGLVKERIPRPELIEPDDGQERSWCVIEVLYAGFCGSDRGIWWRKAFGDMILGSLDDERKDKRIVKKGKTYKPDQIVVDKAGVDVNIVLLDEALAAQVDEILHHPKFQALEAAWRSLRYLIANVNFRENTEIHLLNCNKDDLIDDFEDAPEIAKSGLYRLIYSREYGRSKW